MSRRPAVATRPGGYTTENRWARSIASCRFAVGFQSISVVNLSTDTGSFQYSNTMVRTHEMAADLVGRGLDVGSITTKLYQNYPFRRVELLTALLGTLQRSEDGRVAWWTLPMEVKERLAVEPGDSEGLIDVMRSIRGVVVCAYVEEMPDGRTGSQSIGSQRRRTTSVSDVVSRAHSVR